MRQITYRLQAASYTHACTIKRTSCNKLCQQVVFALRASSCQQFWIKLITTCNKLDEIVSRLVTKFACYCYSPAFSTLLQSDNPESLFRVGIFQQLGTSSAKTFCHEQLAREQTCYNLLVDIGGPYVALELNNELQCNVRNM